MTTKASEIVLAVATSASELRLWGRAPTLVRIHPLDAEVVIAEQWPEVPDPELLTKLMGLDVVLDEETRIGEPVAEFAP